MRELNILEKINQPIFFVTNDVGRAIGMEKLLPNFHIVCMDDHPLVDLLLKDGVSVFCLEKFLGKMNVFFRNAGEILAHPAVLSFIKEKSLGKRPNICFFKPQSKIELLAKKYNFNLLGNAVSLNRKYEDKILFFEFCQKNDLPTPCGEIIFCEKTNFKELARKYGLPFVVQFGHGWAGNSTYFISSENDLLLLKQKKLVGKAKVTKFINGITVLNNCAIYKEKIFISRPALQIKPQEMLTSLSGGTSGRQWPAEVSAGQEKEILLVTKKIGQLMARSGYRGFFGLDFLIEEQTGKIFVSENNARLTASTPFYSKLELFYSDSCPLFLFHLLSFLPENNLFVGDYSPPDLCGSEVVVRNTKGFPVMVNQSVIPGIYNFQQVLVEESPFLNVRNDDLFWLTAAAKGRIVNPEIELIRFNFPFKVCDQNGNLERKYSETISSLIKNIKTARC